MNVLNLKKMNKHRPLHEIGEVLTDCCGRKIQILDYTESRYFFKYLGEDERAMAHNDFCYVIDTYFCRDSSYQQYCSSRDKLEK